MVHGEWLNEVIRNANVTNGRKCRGLIFYPLDDQYSLPEAVIFYIRCEYSMVY